MASFYGWRHEYLMDMEASTFSNYSKCIEVIEAQQQLVSLTSSDWPNLKTDKRKSIFKEIQKVARPGFLVAKKKLEFSPEFLREVIGRG